MRDLAEARRAAQRAEEAQARAPPLETALRTKSSHCAPLHAHATCSKSYFGITPTFKNDLSTHRLSRVSTGYIIRAQERDNSSLRSFFKF